jgi:tripartite-type tricarboxylate transporter receptor subunit TctC
VEIFRVARAPMIMVCSLSSPVNPVADLIAYARANPGKVTYASPGVGSGQHLNGEVFLRYAGAQGVHVPYKGGALAMPDVPTLTEARVAHSGLQSGGDWWLPRRPRRMPSSD